MNQIPQIDLEPALMGGDANKTKVAMEIDRASKDVGFFTVCGHGIDFHLFEQVYAELDAFFKLPLPDKAKCKLETGFTKAADDYTPYGYSGLLEENAYAYMGEFGKPSDYVEKFSVGRLILDNNESLPFPTGQDHFRKCVKSYFQACEGLAATLTELFTVALDLPRDFFAERTNRSNDSLRLQTYPGFSEEFVNRQGMAEHTDGTLLTMLTNSAPGIEVKNRDGDWIRPRIGALDHFLVNIGDLMMRWSNDEYVSTRHRVVLSEQKRQSIVYFKLANDDTVIESFPKFCRERPSKYDPIVYKDFSLQKMNALFDRQTAAD